MNDYIYIFVLIILSVIIILQIIERLHVIQESTKKEDRLLEENSRLVKAVIAKNANDYVMTASIDKVPSETKAPSNPDLVDPDSLDDDEFDAALGIKRTPPKK